MVASGNQPMIHQVGHDPAHKAHHIGIAGGVGGKAAFKAHAQAVGQRVGIGPFPQNDFAAQGADGAQQAFGPANRQDDRLDTGSLLKNRDRAFPVANIKADLFHR